MVVGFRQLAMQSTETPEKACTSTRGWEKLIPVVTSRGMFVLETPCYILKISQRISANFLDMKSFQTVWKVC